MTTNLDELYADDGDRCDCGETPSAAKRCHVCGVWGRIANCGCMDQPRPIAADYVGQPICDDCAREAVG